ncbi:MAG: PQQ-dependent sugar dehydrogenase [Saprospiraceae bacterium]
MKRRFTLQIALVLVSMISLTAQPSINFESFVTGLDEPIEISHAGDDRLFVIERSGRIRVIDASGTLLATPFLDISGNVSDSPNERGLLGLDFHPNYANNGYFYINYTANNGDSKIARYSVNSGNPNVADPNSELELLTVDQPYWNHNGGDLHFGPDGYLYCGFGDGGSGGDPQNFAQNTQSFLGKMLRIDVDNGNPYAIPADNPFVGDANVRDEIWAIGLRNPWRFSFDRTTGDMWIGDVGQNVWEEIDFQPANSTGGENYGWRCYEGNNPFDTGGCGPAGDYVAAIHDYNHNGFTHCSVTGGYVYRGSNYPNMQGYYFYGDYCSGRMWAISPDCDGGWDNSQVGQFPGFLVAFGEDINGELYAVRDNGTIYRMTTPNCPTAFNQSLTKTDASCENNADGTINLCVPAVGAMPYSLLWSNSATTAELTDLAPGNYSVTITSDAGCSQVASISVGSSASPAVPTITANGNDLSTAAGATAYQWYLNGNLIIDGTSENYTATESGDYTVEVTNVFGCTSISISLNVTVVGLEDLRSVKAFSIQPNPFSDQFELNIELTESTRLKVQVLDLLGKTVYQTTQQVDGQWSKTIQLNNLTAGVYLLQLQTETGSFTQKIVKR